jgi:hypothetical protein
MEPWQERVVQEKKELDEKIEKLRGFLSDFANHKNNAELKVKDIAFLTTQLHHMISYSAVLGERIRTWDWTTAAREVLYRKTEL